MSKTAFIFPGQGSQSVGMGLGLSRQYPEAAAYFEVADRVLNTDLSRLIFEGPKEELTKTYNAQPALLTVSTALLSRLEGHGIKADYVAGHSLGEYSALVASGVLSFEDAVAIVRKRGELMEKAVPAGKGTMAAVLGADREALEILCRTVSGQGMPVQLANINCPGQIVISGTAEGVKGIAEAGKSIGAKRVLPLDVSGPFHSILMEPASGELKAAFSRYEWKDARIPVISNVSAEPLTEAALLQEKLIEQLYSPVLWQQCIETLIGLGADTFIEIGPGKVLAGLMKKISRDVRVFSVSNEEEIEAAVRELKGELL